MSRYFFFFGENEGKFMIAIKKIDIKTKKILFYGFNEAIKAKMLSKVGKIYIEIFSLCFYLKIYSF